MRKGERSCNFEISKLKGKNIYKIFLVIKYSEVFFYF